MTLKVEVDGRVRGREPLVPSCHHCRVNQGSVWGPSWGRKQVQPMGPELRPRSGRAMRVGMVAREVDERGHVLQRVHKCGMHCLKWPDTTRTVERGWITERKHWFVRRRTRAHNISLSPDGAPAVTCSHVDFYSRQKCCASQMGSHSFPPSRLPPFTFPFFSTSCLAISNMAALTIQKLDLANKYCACI
jgi:hypothetical protein